MAEYIQDKFFDTIMATDKDGKSIAIYQRHRPNRLTEIFNIERVFVVEPLQISASSSTGSVVQLGECGNDFALVSTVRIRETPAELEDVFQKAGISHSEFFSQQKQPEPSQTLV